MTGPCMCGDPGCRNCFPGTWRESQAEEAIEDIMDKKGCDREMAENIYESMREERYWRE